MTHSPSSTNQRVSLSSYFASLSKKSSSLFREFLWILSEKYELDPTKLTSGEQHLSPSHLATLEEWRNKREEDYPLQYFLKNVEFFDLKFHVEEGALIPRSETEEMARWTVNQLAKTPGPLSILDIGAGTGCLGISIAHHLPQSTHLTLLEPSQEAGRSLDKNIDWLKRSRPQLHIKKSQCLFEDFKFDQPYKLIVSNPPYIKENDRDVALGVYKHEPHMALFGGPLGWEKEVAWVEKAFKNTLPGGLICFEFSHDQKSHLEKVLKPYNPQFFKDSFGKDRFFALKTP